MVFETFGNYVTDAVNPSIIARCTPFKSLDPAHGGGSANELQFSRENGKIQAFVFRFPNEYNSNTFSVRLDFFNDAKTKEEPDNDDFREFTNSGLNIYACGFARNETEANEMAGAFVERFNYLKNNNLLAGE